MSYSTSQSIAGPQRADGRESVAQLHRAPALALVLAEARALFDLLKFRRAAAALAEQCPQGDGHKVLVLPGFLAEDWSTRPLRSFLGRLGYETHGWGLGRNYGPREGVEDALGQRLLELAKRSRGGVSVVGWSLGGLYARELGRLYPNLVRQVVTLGSPFRGDHRASHAWPIFRLLNKRAAHHLTPEARAMRAQPLAMPVTSIYSQTDGVVDWRCCLIPQNELNAHTLNVEVRAAHCALGHHLPALKVIAEQLAAAPKRSRRVKREPRKPAV